MSVNLGLLRTWPWLRNEQSEGTLFKEEDGFAIDIAKIHGFFLEVPSICSCFLGCLQRNPKKKTSNMKLLRVSQIQVLCTILGVVSLYISPVSMQLQLEMVPWHTGAFSGDPKSPPCRGVFFKPPILSQANFCPAGWGILKNRSTLDTKKNRFTLPRNNGEIINNLWNHHLDQLRNIVQSNG